MPSTTEVVDHHLKCFGEGDLEGILADYAPDAVLFTANGPLSGPAEIRPFFQAVLAEFGQPGTTFKMNLQTIVSEFGYFLWTAETADNIYEMATDTLVVRHGKIVCQSFAAKIAPKR